MVKKKLSNDDAKKEYLVDSLRYSISFPLLLILLVLLWHWNYPVAFWIFFGLIILESFSIVIKMNKRHKMLFR